MRLTEDQIRDGIVHADPLVRLLAVRYFADAFRHDPTIMPQVIRAIQQHSWQTGRELLGEPLVQTDETLTWLLAEIAKVDETGSADWSMYQDALLRQLAAGDPDLLLQRQAAIFDLEALPPEIRETIQERIALRTVDPEDGWMQLQDFCEQYKSKEYLSEMPWDHACRLVEAIARHGQAFAPRVLTLLEQKFEDYRNNPLALLQPLAARLAGEMRLEAAIPLLVRPLHEEDDVLRDECERALTKIGSDAVVEAVAAAYPESEMGFAYSATFLLQRIRSERVATKVLEWLPEEDEEDLRAWLGAAAVAQFSFDAIEPVRELILDSSLNPEMRATREDLVAACTLMQVAIPELEAWRAAIAHDREANREYYHKRHPALGELADLLAARADAKLFNEPLPDEDEEELPPTPTQHPKIGRNDPCPCGSGKKFKKCCLGKYRDRTLFE